MFFIQEMREQLDVVLQQKVSSPRMDLYTPLSATPPASSKLIQSIIDLIASEDYQWQVRHALYIQCVSIIIELYFPYVSLHHAQMTFCRLRDWQLVNTCIFVERSNKHTTSVLLYS